MAKTNASSWLVDDTTFEPIIVSVDEGDCSISISHSGCDVTSLDPDDIEYLIDALRAARVAALGRRS